MLKTSAFGLGFQHLPRDLATLMHEKPCLIPIVIQCLFDAVWLADVYVRNSLEPDDTDPVPHLARLALIESKLVCSIMDLFKFMESHFRVHQTNLKLP